MSAENSDRIRRQTSLLLSANCLDSAEALCSLHLSALSTTGDANAAKLSPSFLELLGDIIFRKSEFKRALSYYKQSSQQMKLGMGANNRRRSNLIENIAESHLRFKECQCHIELKDFTTAIRELEAIPLALRDLKINMCMGILYKSANLKRHAISCFSLVVRELPSTIEAIEALVSLGIEAEELLAIIESACKENEESAMYADGWLISLTNSLLLKRNYDHDKCETKLTGLLTSYPKNLYLLTLLGKNSLYAEKYESSAGYFKQARRVDPLAVDFMDQYGLLLLKSAEETELNKLAHELLGLSPDKPIGWLLVAMFCDFKKDSEKALQFVDKAIAQDSKYAPAFRLKAQLLLSTGHPEQAVISFFQANGLEKDISSYSGLIQAYLAVGKFKDAIATAKEVLSLIPRSSTAFFMMGTVLSQVPEGVHEAVRAFTKALRLDPCNSAAAASMSESLMGLGKVEEAVTCLKAILDKKSSAELRTQLAKALALQGLFGDAISELHIALSLTPSDTTAITKEMERIEAMMRGGSDETAEDTSASPSPSRDADEGDTGAEDEEAEGETQGDFFDDEVEGSGGRRGVGLFGRTGSGGGGNSFEDDLDFEEQEGEGEEEEDGQGDSSHDRSASGGGRGGGLLLDYDDEDADLSSSGLGTGTGMGGSVGVGPSGGRRAGDSFYRTQDHVRNLNLNLQTPP